MRTAYGVIRAERLSPPVGARFMAYASSALYSGLAATSVQMQPLTGMLNGFPILPHAADPRDYDQTLTAVAAERVVLDSLLRDGLPTTRASVAQLSDSLDRARMATGVGEASCARSDSLGRQIGFAIVAWSHGDGFDSTRGKPYVPPVGLGLWSTTHRSAPSPRRISHAPSIRDPANPANAMGAATTSDRALILEPAKAPGLKTLPAANMAGVTEPYWGQLARSRSRRGTNARPRVRRPTRTRLAIPCTMKQISFIRLART